METLFIYLIKSSSLIGMFYLAYYFLLRKETFFNSNRWFLLAGLITSVILPLVVFTKIVWVDPTPTDFDWSKIPMTNADENEAFEINWYLVFAIAYSIGILGFLVKFAVDFYSLSKVLKGKTIQKQADFQFIDVTENVSPFSYFNSIVYNSSLYSDTELENILEHEKVHSEQNHTIDVLITRLFCVVFWFNPLVWLYKKAVLQNLEFIADSEASKKISDKKAYQLTLLKITTQENCVAITNHFYQSLIKKRIVMLNKNQSNKRNYWKYAVVLPLLGAFVFFFQVKVVAQEKEPSKQENKTKSNTVDLASIKIEKDLTTLSKEKEIYINGEKSSENELAILDPNEIEKIDVIKKSDNPKILVTTKHSTKPINFTDKEIYINGAKSDKTEMEKLNPEEIERIDVTKNSNKNEIRIITKKHAKMANDNDIYINDKKVSQNELDVLNQETIETMDVNKERKTIRIVTKKGAYNIHDKNAPVPPTPPTPPVLKIKTPPFPNVPRAPKAPKGDPIHGDKKAWKEYEKKMEDFDAKMKKLEPQMEAFDKQMAEFNKQMEPFNKEMEAFEEKMKVFEKQMEEYQSNLNAKKGK
ncbi:BlaR1 peptidase M56 [Flavobacterium fluvii]|uniref:BlaR1 peptidase M56 n=1 Tax=Flavobacterium fluvii TaxID=468056 RepID=A0A1M5N8N6_9FLAO|nr:M56 family metallopeptidase [Flavobacterium fluvii]SHG85847.1 BlaR1 peptidase M56 [Flavobacterium fluvii]